MQPFQGFGPGVQGVVNLLAQWQDLETPLTPAQLVARLADAGAGRDTELTMQVLHSFKGDAHGQDQPENEAERYLVRHAEQLCSTLAFALEHLLVPPPSHHALFLALQLVLAYGIPKESAGAASRDLLRVLESYA